MAETQENSSALASTTAEASNPFYLEKHSQNFKQEGIQEKAKEDGEEKGQDEADQKTTKKARKGPKTQFIYNWLDGATGWGAEDNGPPSIGSTSPSMTPSMSIWGTANKLYGKSDGEINSYLFLETIRAIPSATSDSNSIYSAGARTLGNFDGQVKHALEQETSDMGVLRARKFKQVSSERDPDTHTEEIIGLPLGMDLIRGEDRARIENQPRNFLAPSPRQPPPAFVQRLTVPHSANRAVQGYWNLRQPVGSAYADEYIELVAMAAGLTAMDEFLAPEEGEDYEMTLEEPAVEETVRAMHAAAGGRVEGI